MGKCNIELALAFIVNYCDYVLYDMGCIVNCLKLMVSHSKISDPLIQSINWSFYLQQWDITVSKTFIALEIGPHEAASSLEKCQSTSIIRDQLQLLDSLENDCLNSYVRVVLIGTRRGFFRVCVRTVLENVRQIWSCVGDFDILIPRSLLRLRSLLLPGNKLPVGHLWIRLAFFSSCCIF